MTEHLINLAPTWLIFLTALILPGPDFVGVVRSSLSNGTRAGVLTALGIAISNALFAALSAGGIATLMSQSATFRLMMPLLGAVYLGWLGMSLLQSSSAKGVSTTAQVAVEADHKPWHALLFGISLTLTNPKAIIFFASVFAPALSSNPSGELVLLVVMMVALSAFIWFSTVAALISSPPVLKRFRGMESNIDRVAGVFFLGFAVWIVVGLLN